MTGILNHCTVCLQRQFNTTIPHYSLNTMVDYPPDQWKVLADFQSRHSRYQSESARCSDHGKEKMDSGPTFVLLLSAHCSQSINELADIGMQPISNHGSSFGTVPIHRGQQMERGNI